MLHSRQTDFHKIKAKRVAHIVTATYLNLSPAAHEIISQEAPKEGKFAEGLCTWIFPSYSIQPPSQICNEKHRCLIRQYNVVAHSNDVMNLWAIRKEEVRRK